MIKIPTPVRVEITGENTTGSAVLTVGSSPLPADNAVTPFLFGIEVSVEEECTVKLLSNATVLYEKNFAGAGRDVVTGIARKGAPTHGIKAYVEGCGAGNMTVILADLGYEYNGGVIATGGSRW